MLNMKIATLLLSLALSLGISAGAQTLDLTVDLPADSMRIFIKPLNQTSGKATEIPVADRQAKGEVAVNPDGLYYIYASGTNSRYALPIYIPATNGNARFSIDINPYTISTSLPDSENKALSSFSATQINKSQNLGNNFPLLTNEQIKGTITGYLSDADSIIGLAPITQTVTDYLRLWAYLSAVDAYNMSLNLAHRYNRPFNVAASELLPEAAPILDTPLAPAFPSAGKAIINSLPKGTLEERLAAVENLYKTP